jgi:predicted Zn-dependent protease
MRSKTWIAGAVVASVAAAGGAAAQSGQRQLSAGEVRQAQAAHPQILQEFGGAETGARAAYVTGVGRRIAAQSNIANAGAATTITTLNSPVMNAFAIPGGYVYITRQLLGVMNDEAELASVLGHEVGHIAANHSKSRTRSGVFSQLGAVLVGVVTGSGQLAQAAGQVAQLATLKFSRDQEFQSDALGVSYLNRAGYDPAATASMLRQLGAATTLDGRVAGRNDERTTPSWSRTHPLSEDRVRRALAAAQKTGKAGVGLRNRDQFLAAIDGVMVDDDPRQGVIDGNQFVHPDLRLKFTAPSGYTMQNGTTAVAIQGQGGQAQFGTGAFNGDLTTYISDVYTGLTGGKTQVQVPRPQTTNVNGKPAAFTVTQIQGQSGPVDVGVFAVRWDPTHAYHFVTITRAGSQFGPFQPMIQSLSAVTASEAAAIRPRVIDIVTVRPGDTVQSLAARMAYRDFQLERFTTLNGLARNAALRSGQKVKLVVYGERG